MRNTSTGGPAFPHSSEDPDGQIRTHWHGMTLRDYFAAKVLQGAMVNATRIDQISDDILFNVSQQCYRMADAMLKAREA